MSLNKREKVNVNATNFFILSEGSFYMLSKKSGAAAMLFA